MSNVSFSLMILKVVVHDGFTSKNLLFEISLASEFELFGEDESCLDRVAIELAGGNRICVSSLFDVFTTGKFSFLSVTDVCSGVTLFISVARDPHGE